MVVSPLFVTTDNRTIQFQHMRLDMETVDWWYLGLLEINSNKFYVRFILNDGGVIGEFEVYGVKWYIEFTVKVIKIIRNIVQNLTSLLKVA